MFEIHITCETEDQELIESIAKDLHWKTSTITGDPQLGPATRFYITTHRDTFPQAYMDMMEMHKTLVYNGIIPTRLKIENIIFDTKLGKDYLFVPLV